MSLWYMMLIFFAKSMSLRHVHVSAIRYKSYYMRLLSDRKDARYYFIIMTFFYVLS